MICPMSRREFLRLSTYTAILTGIGSIGIIANGCSHVPGKLGKVTSGFQVYNGINPNVLNKQRQTYLDNINEHKAAWGGIQYHRYLSEHIVAPARGRVSFKITTNNLHQGLEDQITLSHGGRFNTIFYHIKPNSTVVNYGDVVERGQEIAYAEGLPLKIKMNFIGNYGDMDDYGPNMGYMQFWKGEELDREPNEVELMSKQHVALIDEMRQKYLGPGKEIFKESSGGIPKKLSHDYEGWYNWTHAMFFKLMKNIYDNHPELFRGTRAENDKLINDIYNSQPVILTLPFKKT